MLVLNLAVAGGKGLERWGVQQDAQSSSSHSPACVLPLPVFTHSMPRLHCTEL